MHAGHFFLGFTRPKENDLPHSNISCSMYIDEAIALLAPLDHVGRWDSSTSQPRLNPSGG